MRSRIGRPRIKTDIGFTKATLMFCFGLRFTFCSFVLDLNQAEQKVLRLKFVFVLCCLLVSSCVDVVLRYDKSCLSCQSFQLNFSPLCRYIFQGSYFGIYLDTWYLRVSKTCAKRNTLTHTHPPRPKK